MDATTSGSAVGWMEEVVDRTEVVRVDGAPIRAPGPDASDPRIVH